MNSQADGKSKDEITLVAPAGQTEQERYHANQLVEHLLKKAVDDFGRARLLDPSLQYVLVFNGAPLDLRQSLGDAGVHPGARLSVRAKEIPGDGNAPFPK
jgi:hypothetical protein